MYSNIQVNILKKPGRVTEGCVGMGTYLNPGKELYEEAVNSEIFIDKSEMLLYLNSVLKTKKKYVSVSRPRRFGKSMAADMICAYYDREAKSRELFENLLLSKCTPAKTHSKTITWDGYLGKFDVIRVVMTKFLKKGITAIQALERYRPCHREKCVSICLQNITPKWLNGANYCNYND